MEDWKVAKLSSLAFINYGYTESATADPIGPRFLRITDIQSDGVDWSRVPFCPIEAAELNKFRLANDDIVFARTGATTGKSFLVQEPPEAVFASYLIRLRLRTQELLPRFVNLFFQTAEYWSAIAAGSTGSAQGGFNASKLGDLSIRFPSVIEQRRIVTILDEAFEGIATAKANAEKNLQNAREVFESALDAALSRHGGKFVETSLGDEVDLVAGYAFPSKGYVANGIRLLRGDNIMQGYLRWDDAKAWPAADLAPYAHFALQEGDVVLAMDRPWVKAGLKRAQIGVDDLPCLQLQRTARLRPRARMRVDFLYHLTGSKSFSRHLLGVQTGLGVPHISGKQIESFRFMLPPPKEQASIADMLDDLQQCSDRLEEIYLKKAAAFDELKKSLLHKAFSGQLTSSEKTVVVSQPAVQTTTPEFAANVIAIAHARHERQKRERTFGHVKEQKFLHLVESVAKIDLGRRPMRDAAGPNDFAHMLKAEEWAKANRFFEVVKRDGGYEFRKLSGFDEHMSSARKSLAPYLPQLERVIDLLVPMDTEEAEVFATVHAAWNNLLIDQAEVTDAAIVSAAREGWHAGKLKIDEYKFRAAIELIRQKGLVPDGTAKYVGGQQSLL